MEIISTVPTLESLKGLWTRSLIAWPDGARDTTTQVWWLQGPGLYCDLRQPKGAPSFSGVHRLADVTPLQLEWMAQQEAFAGKLIFDGSCFEWQRGVNLHPSSAYADRGRLQFDTDVLIEHGEHIPYIEHWHRRTLPVVRASAAMLELATGGARGYLVRVDDFFMYARTFDRELPFGANLIECVRAAPNHQTALQLLDFEVAIGRIQSAGWVIEHSSLPFRSGHRLEPKLEGRSSLALADSDFHLGTRAVRWHIAELRGSITHLLPDYRSDSSHSRSVS